MIKKYNLLFSGFWLISIIVFIAIGFKIALISTNIEIQIDYDSGAQRQVIYAGPFKLREDEFHKSNFYLLRLNNGYIYLSGIPNWHTALKFRGKSNRSPNYQAGLVMNEIARIEGWHTKWDSKVMAGIKERFLIALANNDIDLACKVAHDYEDSVSK